MNVCKLVAKAFEIAGLRGTQYEVCQDRRALTQRFPQHSAKVTCLTERYLRHFREWLRICVSCAFRYARDAVLLE